MKTETFVGWLVSIGRFDFSIIVVHSYNLIDKYLHLYGDFKQLSPKWVTLNKEKREQLLLIKGRQSTEFYAS